MKPKRADLGVVALFALALWIVLHAAG